MQNSKLTAKGPGYRRLSWANASASAATQSATGKQRHRFARYGARPVRCESISALKFLPYCRTSPHARGHGLLLTPTRGTTRVCPPQGQGRRTSRTAARHMWCQDPERHTLPDEERARQASLQVPWRQKHRAKNTERQSTDSGSSTEKVARLSRKGIDRICDCRAELLAMSEPRGGQEISGGTRHSTSSTDIALKGFSLCFRSHQMLIGLLRSRHGSWTVPGDVRELLGLGKLVSSAVRQAGGPALGPD